MNSQRIYNYHRFPNASPISIPIPIAFKIIRISDIIFGRKSTLNHSTLKKRKRKRKQNCMEKRRRKRSPPLFIVIGEWIAKLHFPRPRQTRSFLHSSRGFAPHPLTFIPLSSVIMLSITCPLSLRRAVYALEFAPTPELPPRRVCTRVRARIGRTCVHRSSPLVHGEMRCTYARTLNSRVTDQQLVPCVRIACVRGCVQVRKGHARTVVQQVRGDERALDDYLY